MPEYRRVDLFKIPLESVFDPVHSAVNLDSQPDIRPRQVKPPAPAVVKPMLEHGRRQLRKLDLLYKCGDVL